MAPAVSSSGPLVIQVIPLLGVRSLGDRRFSYTVPDELAAGVVIGSLVRVPFRHRDVRAVVVGMGPDEEQAMVELRPILSVLEDRIPADLLRLAHSVSKRYLAPLESCLRLVVPPPTAAKTRVRGVWVVPASPVLTASSAGDKGAVASAGSACEEDLGPLVRLSSRLTAKQRAVLASLTAAGAPIGELCQSAGVTASVVRALAQKGLVRFTSGTGAEEAERARISSELVLPGLWPEQEEAVRRLIAAYEQPGLAHELLWGVTGSGKTEVYLRLIAHVLEEGASAVLLVPEIVLTPQMVERVRARFGSLVAVYHSALPRSERLREYKRMRHGEARVVVGARSAVFAPVDNLRLIIMDESHDSSYKQDEEPRYHARTVAKLRLAETGGLLLEGTATPAAESLIYAGKPLRLSRRAAGSKPVCEIIDMRTQGGATMLAPVSREALAQVVRNGEQAIVLLNRRGYAGRVYCELCGHVLTCSSCELSLTYHSRERRLLCHHCGRVHLQPSVCPACGRAPLTRSAPGTERLDRELRALLPADKVFRMDSDVLTSGTRARRVLESFACSLPAVLVGTQMVAKGHDFPEVTLVLVADADTGLYVPDFRAAERTFQLLTQVAGRAGRARKPGRVLVQTWNPNVPCIKMALERREDEFYRLELESRKRLGYPPFVELIRIVCLGAESKPVEAGVRYLGERLAPYFAAQEIRGPVRLPRLRRRVRWQLLVAARDGERARAILARALASLEEPYRRRGVALVVDVDPDSFL